MEVSRFERDDLSDAFAAALIRLVRESDAELAAEREGARDANGGAAAPADPKEGTDA